MKKELLDETQRIDWSLIQIYDLCRCGYLDEENYNNCISQLCELYGTEYISSRMANLSLM